jgi:hypothetical protein
VSALRESSDRRLSVLDEVLRAHARYRAWRRLRRAGLAGALLLLTVLVSLWPGPASAPAHKVWPGSTLVVSVPIGQEPHAAPCAARIPSAHPAAARRACAGHPPAAASQPSPLASAASPSATRMPAGDHGAGARLRVGEQHLDLVDDLRVVQVADSVHAHLAGAGDAVVRVVDEYGLVRAYAKA